MSIYHDILHSLQPLQPIPTSQPRRIHPFPECKAILFDIYGTLLISASGDIGHQDMQAQAVEKAVAHSSLARRPLDHDLVLTLYRTLIDREHEQLKHQGLSYPEVNIQAIWTQLYWELGLLNDSSETSVHERNRVAFAFECNINPVWPMPHFNHTLERLMASDLYLGIISNAQFYTPILVNHFLGQRQSDGDHIAGFEPSLVYFSWQISRAKPDPWAFRQCLATLSTHRITPQNVLFVGNDKLNDIYPASQVGMKTCLFAGDQRSLRLREDDSQVNKIEPDFVIDDLKQLLDIVLV